MRQEVREIASLARPCPRATVSPMPYAGQFHRLVMFGTLFADTFNVTLSIAPTPGPNINAPTQALVDALASDIANWWDNALAAAPGNGLTINGNAVLTGIKLNRIGPDGKYVDPDTFEKILTTPVVGGGGSGNPPQLSLVSTLRGPDERGAAGKGRMYWPVSQLAAIGLDTTGRVAVASATQYAHGVATFIRLVNSRYATSGPPAVAAIASKTGSGRFQVVTKVTVGRVPDTMRSRRNKQLEDPVEVTV